MPSCSRAPAPACIKTSGTGIPMFAPTDDEAPFDMEAAGPDEGPGRRAQCGGRGGVRFITSPNSLLFSPFKMIMINTFFLILRHHTPEKGSKVRKRFKK